MKTHPEDNEPQAYYDCGITNIPAHFVTPICHAIRQWVENKSEWKDKEDISKIVDELIFFKKLKGKEDEY